MEGERNQESNSGCGKLEMFSIHLLGNVKQTAGWKSWEFIETQGRATCEGSQAALVFKAIRLDATPSLMLAGKDADNGEKRDQLWALRHSTVEVGGIRKASKEDREL